MRAINIVRRTCVAVLILCSALPLWSQQTAPNAGSVIVPPMVNFSGRLTDLNGQPLTGTVAVTFYLYKGEQGGAPLWMETQNVQPDRGGHYAVMLGSTSSTGLPADIFVAGEARWLGVQPQGQQERPRVMLLSVPYALKAGDAQTLGGLPASAFVLTAPAGNRGVTSAAPNAAAGSTAAPPPATSNVTTTGGTVNALPLWTTATNVQSSAITQTGTGATAKIGIGTATPASALDVKGGTTVRGTLSLPAAGAATAAQGANSQPLSLAASAFNSGTSAGVNQVFQWKAEPAGNDTASPSATLNLLFGSGTSTPAESGVKISNTGLFTFVPTQKFPGTGTITGVTAGTDLLGGGTSGNVALSLDTTKVPRLATANTFGATQSVIGDVDATNNVNAAGSVNVGKAYLLGGQLFDSGSAANSNAFLGFAGNLTTTGASNTAEGYRAFSSNTLGCCNVANGSGALTANIDGCCNVSSGSNSLVSNTSGSNNTADGYQTLFENTTGGYNTAVGIDAFASNSTGSNNTALGRAAGNPTVNSFFTGSGNTFLGTSTNTGTLLNINNATAIGVNSQVTSSDSMVLGAIAGVNNATTSTKVGIGTTAPAFSLDVHGTGNFTGPVAFASGQAFPGTLTGATTAAGSGLTSSVSSGNLNLSLLNSCAAMQVLQWTGGAWACSAAGSGTITGVTAGADLTGGGTSGTVTLNLDTTKVPLLAAANTFLNSQAILGSLAVVNNNTYQPMLVQSSSTFGTWLELSNTSTGGQTWNFLSAGGANAEGAGNLGITNLKGGSIWLEGPIHGTSTLRVEGPSTAGGLAASFGGNGDFAIDAPGIAAGRFVVKDTTGFVGINDTAPVHPLSVSDTTSSVAIEGGTTYAGQAAGVQGVASDPNNNTAGVRAVNFSNQPNSAALIADNNGSSGGNLILGRFLLTHEFRVDTSGNVFASQYFTSGADFAESVAVAGGKTLYQPGDLLAIDEKSDRRLSLVSQPYSSLVAGIYATKPGVLASPYQMDDPELAKEVPLAVVGIVLCKVSTENGSIERGDLLVSSSIPGYAMKGTDRNRMLGAVVGKALEPLANGRGTIQVLVTLQ